MEPGMILGGISAAFATGLGLRFGSRLIPIAIDAQRYLKTHRKNSSESLTLPPPLKPQGGKRESSIVGIYKDVLRHRDGSYTRFYTMPLEETMLANDKVSERRCDD